MKKLQHLLILFLLPMYIFSQNSDQKKITYGYDAAGNRIKREIVMNATKSAFAEADIFTEELAERIIKIYPNPTKGQLAVEIPDIESVKSANLTLFNMQGQIISKTKATLLKTDLDISSKPNGIYILHINIDGQVSSWRIIKE